MADAPVISVGNLAMGGRGKTPVVIAIARRFVEAGERPAVLSRGYGRRRRDDGAVVVSDGRHLLADVDRAGDEPLLIARAVPGVRVVVCEQRAIAAALAERALGATVHILDDGFQHRAMRRDLDIVIVAPADLDDRRMPFGHLREPVSALERAHALIVDGPADVASAFATPERPMFSMRRSLGSPVPLESGQPAPAPGQPVFAMAGIASPRRFSDALESAGWRVAGSMSFRDHHRFTRRDLAQVAAAARAAGASIVVTTMKDAMRLLPLRPFDLPIAGVPLEVAIDPAPLWGQILNSCIATTGVAARAGG